MTGEPLPPAPDDEDVWLNLPPMRYPSEYVWFVLVSTLDILLTWVILKAGGSEVNPIAAMVINAWKLPGAIGFKFALTLFVIVACEIVGRHRDRVGRGLIRFGIVIAGLPPLWSMYLLLMHLPEVFGE